MGMSLHVIGFRPPDEKWKAMRAVWDTCRNAGIDPPSEVERFFGDERPDESGIKVSLETSNLNIAQEWSDDYRAGLEIDLDELREKLPGVTKIRFYASW